MGGCLREEDIVQNLKDAGCDEETAADFLEALKRGDTAKGEKLLERHRRSLLNKLHAEQRKIDCLDYLIFNMKKQSRQG